MVAVLSANSAPETSLSYNRLNVSYVHLKSDTDGVDVSTNGAAINFQVSDPDADPDSEPVYLNLGLAFANAEADDFDIDGESFESLLGVGTYLALSDIIHLNLGVDGTYGQGDVESLDFDSWSITPYVGLRVAVLTNLEIYGSIGYSFGEIEFDDFDGTEDIDEAVGDIGLIYGLTDNIALKAGALFAEDTVGGEFGLQLNF